MLVVCIMYEYKCIIVFFLFSECSQNELKTEKVRKQGRWHFHVLEDQITQRRDLQGITISSVVAVSSFPTNSTIS